MAAENQDFQKWARDIAEGFRKSTAPHVPSEESKDHWRKVRGKLAKRTYQSRPPSNPITDLQSAKKQLARCEREAQEWRDVIARLEKHDG